MCSFSATPQVSVVIPVYNAADYLEECLQSIADQTLGLDAIEVVAVNDGSTDRSGAVLDEWAARHLGRITVLHQENSGAPGGPRNRGIDRARGEFLFFADPDDYLGTEALERLTAAADRDRADVVLGRIKGVGRRAATAPFAHNVAGGDIWTTNGVWSLTAHKLFRRSLVEKHGLRFTEGLRLAEEQTFVVSAYFAARAVSVVADYDCYYLVRREAYPHLTQQTPEPEPFYAAVRQVLEIVEENTVPGPRRNRLLDRWTTQEIARYFKDGFPRLDPELQRRFVDQAGAVLRDFVPEELVESLPPLERVRLRLLREGRAEELAAFAALAPTPARRPGPEPRAEQRASTSRKKSPPWLSRGAPRRLARGLKYRLTH